MVTSSTVKENLQNLTSSQELQNRRLLIKTKNFSHNYHHCIHQCNCSKSPCRDFPITTIRPKGETNREQIYGRWPGALPDNRTTNQSEESNEPLEKTRILHKYTPHRTHPQPPPPSSSNPNAQEQARLNCSRASGEASPQPRAGAEFTEKETPAPASPINTADNYTITRGNTGWRLAESMHRYVQQG